MAKVIVTGGAGFIGSHVVEALLQENYDVSVIDNFSSGHPENIAGLPVHMYIGDVTDPGIINLVQSIKPDFLIHLAAQISVAQSVADPLFDEQTNVKGSLNMIQAARLIGLRKIIFSSSAAVYGNPRELPVTEEHPTDPESPYGLTKLTVENYLRLFHKFYGVPYGILRFSNVYGPRQDAAGEGGVVSIFADRIRKGTEPTIYGDGKQTRDFIYVKDVASAVVHALKPKKSFCVNVSSCSSVTINELFRIMKRVSNSDLGVIYGPVRKGDIRDSILSNEAAKRILGWEPKEELAEGLRRTIGRPRTEKHAIG